MLVPILMESPTDEAYAQKIAKVLEEFGVKIEMYVASSYKVPELVLDIVNEFNQSNDNIVYITLARGSNGLSGMVSANAIHPVIACPIFKDKSDYLANIHSTTQYAKDVPSMCVITPENAAHAAIRILALTDKGLRKRVTQHIQEVKEGF